MNFRDTWVFFLNSRIGGVKIYPGLIKQKKMAGAMWYYGRRKYFQVN